jgi:hypothetical protein
MRRLLSLSAFALAVTLTGTSHAQYSYNISTGTLANGTGGLLADTAQDTRYNVTAITLDPISPNPGAPINTPGGATYVALQNTFPFPYWSTDSQPGDPSPSKWIAPYADGNIPINSTATLAGNYSFTTAFNLADPLTASITGGLWATDNTGVAVYLNGHSLGATATGFTSFSIFNANVFAADFVSGNNILEFVVHNAPQASGNPVGLRVEASVNSASPVGPGVAGVPEPASVVMFGTAFLVVSGVTWSRNRKAKAVPQS